MAVAEAAVARVCLIHWKEAELAEKVALLTRAGHRVDAWHEVDGAKALRSLKTSPPDALLIDLSRLPSHGREIGVALRAQKATRGIPLVFVEGKPEKVERVKAVLPDATYATWRTIRSAVTRATKRPLKDPVVPSSNLAAYAGTPLPKKLGIKPESVVALVGAPRDFEKTLGALPESVTLRRDARAKSDLTLFFPRSSADLTARIVRLTPRAAHGGLWIVWPKKASGVESDLTQVVVRRIGLAAGLVDFKVCAVDGTYSGLRFTKR